MSGHDRSSLPEAGSFLLIIPPMLRAAVFFSITFWACSLYAQQPVDPQAFRSVGTPHLREDTATYRLTGGFGANLGRLTDAPLTTYFRLTHQDGPWFFGLGLNSSQNVSSRDTQFNVGDFDLLTGLSWDYKVQRYSAS